MNSDPPNTIQAQLAQLTRRIRDRTERMREAGADHVRLARAQGGDLHTGRELFTQHGTWLTWLRQACELRQRQALSYVALWQHHDAVEAYLQRAANSGARPSIRGALAFISPPDVRSKKPRKLSEVETAAMLGPFLEQHPDLFFEALPLAPTLKAAIESRLQRPLHMKLKKAEQRAAQRGPTAPLVARGDARSLH